MTTPKPGLIALQHVYFTGPVPLHGRLVREIVRGQPLPDADGSVLPGWEPNLHRECGCIVVEAQEDGMMTIALVPLHSVRSMTMVPSGPVEEVPVVDEASPAVQAARRGRVRTKRLEFVRD